MSTLGIAIIGCGFAGNFHSNAWVKVNYIDIKLKAAVDNNLERAQALKEKWNYEYATADYDQVLADPEIDIIDIALPPFLHLPFALSVSLFFPSPAQLIRSAEKNSGLSQKTQAVVGCIG